MDVGEAESLPLLNEEVSKSSNCGGRDSSAPIGGFLRPYIEGLLRSYLGDSSDPVEGGVKILMARIGWRNPRSRAACARCEFSNVLPPLPYRRNRRDFQRGGARLANGES